MTDEAALPADYKLEQPCRCTSCQWTGKRRELIWSQPRGYICPQCYATTIDIEDTMNTTNQAPGDSRQGTAPLRTNYELRFIAFQMATKYLMQKPPKEHPLTRMIEEVLIKMRDECDADRQRLASEVARLQAQLENARKWLPDSALGGDDD